MGHKPLTTGQIAKICNVSSRTVTKWFDSGRLKGYRIPGSQDRRIPRENLIKFLNSHGMPLGELETDLLVKVVFVSQDAILYQVAQKYLTKENGFAVAFADCAFEAGSKFYSFPAIPDALVVDFDIGTRDAQDICRNLLQSDKFSGIQVIAITSNSTPSELQPLADMSFKKPFDFGLLAQRLKEVVRMKRS